jgi:hypothetical protein
LNFISDGSFTWTLTPSTTEVTAAVAEPGSFKLLAFWLAGIGFLRRRRR